MGVVKRGLEGNKESAVEEEENGGGAVGKKGLEGNKGRENHYGGILFLVGKKKCSWL